MKTLKIFLSLLLLMIVSNSIIIAGNNLQEETKSFSVSKGGILIVNVNPGDITIGTWEKNEVLIKVGGLEKDDLRDLMMQKKDNKIYVEFESNWGRSNDTKFYITIPSQFSVDIKTTGGDIDLKGNIKGSLDASTFGGDVDFMSVVGDVNVSTSGGDISCIDIEGKLRLNTQGGDIRIGSVKLGDAKVSTMGGDIRIDDVSSDLEVKTYGGDITVGNIGGSAEVVTYGGDIKLQEVSGSVDMSTYGGNLSLKSASGHVKASTYGGNITLENITGTVDAKTSAGRIRVELNPAGKGSSRLKTSAGDIELTIPSTAKVTIEAEIEFDGHRERRKKEYKIISDFKEKTYVNEEDSIFAVYELNGGGEKIRLETVNSNIKIKKSSK